MSESFAEMFEESLKDTVMTVGEVIKAEVVSVDGDYVTVTAGLKSEAEIPLSQFAKVEGEFDVNIGDLVEVAIESVEDGYGRTKLSHDKARRVRVWAELEKAHENEDIVVGQITGKVKGGFTVSLQNVRAFLPGSLAQSAKSYLKPSKKVKSFAVSLRTLLTMVPLLILVVSTVYCTSPIWPGSESSILQRFWKLVRTSKPRYSSSIKKKPVYL